MKRDEDGTNKGRKCGWIRKERKERKGKREERANKGEREELDREREKGERETKREIFPAFRRSNLDSPRVKVDPCIAGYAWGPKS